MWNGQDQLRGCVHDRVERVITVQLKDTQIYIVSAEDRLQHEKANGNALEAHLVNLIFGNINRQDSIAVAANELGSLAEQQIPVGTRHVEHQALRSILHELAEELQHWRRNRRIVRPNLNGSNEDRGVCRVNPIEEHHVGSFLIKAVSQAADVASETDQSILHLLARVYAVHHHSPDGVKCVWKELEALKTS